jgi:hypothetical protein
MDRLPGRTLTPAEMAALPGSSKLFLSRQDRPVRRDLPSEPEFSFNPESFDPESFDPESFKRSLIKQSNVLYEYYDKEQVRKIISAMVNLTPNKGGRRRKTKRRRSSSRRR